MAGENDFLPIATAGGAPVFDQADWIAATPANGRGPGILPKEYYNKAARQSSAVAAMIGQFIANTGGNALDDGTPNTTLLAAFVAALATIIPAPPAGLVKAWANFGYVSGTLIVHASGNVGSVVRTAAGVYTVNFNSSFVDTGYAISGSSLGRNVDAPPGPFLWSTDGVNPVLKTTNACTIAIISGSGPEDNANVSVVFTR